MWGYSKFRTSNGSMSEGKCIAALDALVGRAFVGDDKTIQATQNQKIS